jgi:23S rRNA pseudouridine1911/1915/1917 synthase
VLVAKTRAAHASLQKALARRGEKDYLAVVYGRVGAARGIIDLRLGRQPGDRRRVVASATEGTPSRTAFERLDRVTAPRVGLSLLRCRLLTGRMHQIRVHLAARGWSLVGDGVYGDARWSEVEDPDLSAALRRFPRQALHAWRVAFTHPITRSRLVLEAPIPADLRALLALSRLDAATSPRGSATVGDD